MHYGFLHEVGGVHCRFGKVQGGSSCPRLPCTPTHPLQDDRTKLAAFLETTFLKYRGTQA